MPGVARNIQPPQKRKEQSGASLFPNGSAALECQLFCGSPPHHPQKHIQQRDSRQAALLFACLHHDATGHF